MIHLAFGLKPMKHDARLAGLRDAHTATRRDAGAAAGAAGVRCSAATGAGCVVSPRQAAKSWG